MCEKCDAEVAAAIAGGMDKQTALTRYAQNKIVEHMEVNVEVLTLGAIQDGKEVEEIRVISEEDFDDVVKSLHAVGKTAILTLSELHKINELMDQQASTTGDLALLIHDLGSPEMKEKMETIHAKFKSEGTRINAKHVAIQQEQLNAMADDDAVNAQRKAPELSVGEFPMGLTAEAIESMTPEQLNQAANKLMERLPPEVRKQLEELRAMLLPGNDTKH